MDHHHETLKSVSTDILVVGAGIAGITAALEAAETGFKVILVETLGLLQEARSSRV